MNSNHSLNLAKVENTLMKRKNAMSFSTGSPEIRSRVTVGKPTRRDGQLSVTDQPECGTRECEPDIVTPQLPRSRTAAGAAVVPSADSSVWTYLVRMQDSRSALAQSLATLVASAPPTRTRAEKQHRVWSARVPNFKIDRYR